MRAHVNHLARVTVVSNVLPLVVMAAQIPAVMYADNPARSCAKISVYQLVKVNVGCNAQPLAVLCVVILVMVPVLEIVTELARIIVAALVAMVAEVVATAEQAYFSI